MAKNVHLSKEQHATMMAWINSHGTTLQQITDAFYLQYGKTLAGWAALEESRCDQFQRPTRMTDTMATKIFYSARSFNGRADMFEAAIAASKAAPIQLALLKEAIKKTRTCSGSRNRLAHGDFVITPIFPPDYDLKKTGWRMILKQGSDIGEDLLDKGTTIEEMTFADSNFRRLAALVAEVHRGKGPSRDKRRQPIRELPTL